VFNYKALLLAIGGVILFYVINILLIDVLQTIK